MYDFNLNYMKNNYKFEFVIMYPVRPDSIWYFWANWATPGLETRMALEWEIEKIKTRKEKISFILRLGYTGSFANWFVDYVEAMKKVELEFYENHYFGKFINSPKLEGKTYLSTLNKYLKGGM